LLQERRKMMMMQPRQWRRQALKTTEEMRALLGSAKTAVGAAVAAVAAVLAAADLPAPMG
jgi:hypothetical protein